MEDQIGRVIQVYSAHYILDEVGQKHLVFDLEYAWVSIDGDQKRTELVNTKGFNVVEGDRLLFSS